MLLLHEHIVVCPGSHLNLLICVHHALPHHVDFTTPDHTSATSAAPHHPSRCSFTTQERSALWLNYAKAHRIPAEAAAAPAPVAYNPRHLQLVRFLLEWVMSSAPDASITEYTIEVPDWMVGYAARWGWGQSSIKLLVLQGYPAIDPGCSRTHSSRTHSCRLFVPMSIA
jgi:hypothetical protein